jgi:hypothetical protein
MLNFLKICLDLGGYVKKFLYNKKTEKFISLLKTNALRLVIILLCLAHRDTADRKLR